MTWRMLWSTYWGKAGLLISGTFAVLAIVVATIIVWAGTGQSRMKIAILASGGPVKGQLADPVARRDGRGRSYFVDVSWTDARGVRHERPAVPISSDYYARITRNGVLVMTDTPLKVGSMAGNQLAVIVDDPQRLWNEASNEQMPFALLALFMGLAIGGYLVLIIVKASAGVKGAATVSQPP